MHKRPTPFDSLCDPEHLMSGWKRVRANRGAPGVDRMTIVNYERDLITNLDDLSARIKEGRYYPMPLRRVEMQKRSGGTRMLGILTVEDRIVQRAALDALEPLFEPSMLDCSYGFRPARSVEMAINRVLDYRASGDLYIVDADIENCFDSLDHTLLMKFVGARVRDKRMLALIRMWLDTGQVLPSSKETDPSPAQRTAQAISGSVKSAIASLIDNGEYSRAGYPYVEAMSDSDWVASDEVDIEADLQRRARNEALKRIGRDGALLALTYIGRARKLVTPTSLALAGAAVLAAAAYPKASRLIRRSFGPSSAGAIQGGALSPLLCNIYLHEFDLAMLRAGLHLVRYADDFVILCQSEASAATALDLSARKLTELKLTLHPQKTRILRFDEGVEFLGYRFDPFLARADPAPSRSGSAVTAIEQVRHIAKPAISKLSRRASQQIKSSVNRIASTLKRLRGDHDD